MTRFTSSAQAETAPNRTYLLRGRAPLDLAEPRAFIARPTDRPARVVLRYRTDMRDYNLFLAIGTSGTVTPAANFVRSARYAGARTILVNLEAMAPHNPEFDEQVLGRAEEVVPALLSSAG